MKVKRRNSKRGRVEIIPMIDTIVILLIFYMSLARMAQMERESNIALPTAVAGEEFKKLPNQVIVNVFSATDVSVAGQRLEMKDLGQVLLGLKSAPGPEGPLDAVIVRGDKNILYRDLSDVMRACAKAGIADVSLSALEP